MFEFSLCGDQTALGNCGNLITYLIHASMVSFLSPNIFSFHSVRLVKCFIEGSFEVISH